jgi:uncharacterized protein
MHKQKIMKYKSSTSPKIQNLVLITILLFIFGCKTPQKVNNAGLEKSLLWRLESKEATKPSYLFGTIHIIDSKKYFLPKGTLSAIDECKKMVFEIDMEKMSDMTNMMGMMGKIMMKDGKTLRDLVSKEEYGRIENHFKKMGLPMFMFEKMKPFFLTIFAEEGMDPQALQTGTMKSYEMEFAELARDKEMSTGGLETIEFQMSLFDQISYEDQAKMLVEAIDGNKTKDNTMDKMIEYYQAQDVDKLSDLINDEGGDIQNFNDRLVTDRNKNWIQGIRDEIKAQPTFIAVGAGHLGGANGVIRLLRQNGIKVTAVKQ